MTSDMRKLGDKYQNTPRPIKGPNNNITRGKSAGMRWIFGVSVLLFLHPFCGSSIVLHLSQFHVCRTALFFISVDSVCEAGPPTVYVNGTSVALTHDGTYWVGSYTTTATDPDCLDVVARNDCNESDPAQVNVVTLIGLTRSPATPTICADEAVTFLAMMIPGDYPDLLTWDGVPQPTAPTMSVTCTWPWPHHDNHTVTAYACSASFQTVFDIVIMSLGKLIPTTPAPYGQFTPSASVPFSTTDAAQSTDPDIEVEVGDSVALTLITDGQCEDMHSTHVVWTSTAPDGAITTQVGGLTYSLSGAGTGTYVVAATYNGASLTAAIHVNNNATTPIRDCAVMIIGDRWAHVSDESIALHASGVDTDWFNGQLRPDNQLSLESTTWFCSPLGAGNFTPSVGQNVYFTPLAVSESIGVTATFCDSINPHYTPRNEPDQIASPTPSPGGFAVSVTMVVGSPGVTSVSATRDEYGSGTGTLPIETRGLELNQTATAQAGVLICFPGTCHTIEQSDKPTPISSTVNVTWLFETIPNTAVPRSGGLIEAQLDVSGAAAAVYAQNEDQSWISITPDVEWSISPGLPLGFAIGTTISGAKLDSSVPCANVSACFDSNDLGSSHPNACRLEWTSDGASPVLPLMGPPATTVKKAKGTSSQLLFQGFVHVEATDRNHHDAATEAFGRVQSLIVASFADVRYVPPGTP